MNTTPKQPPGCDNSSLPDSSQTEMWTNEELKMCGLKNCADTPSAIFSPESEDGVLRCSSQDGPKIGQSGRGVVPVSLSAWPGGAEAPTTNGTSGPSLPNSSAPVSLQSCLANRLQARLVGIGSPEYLLTWKEWPISGQEPICALRASALRTSDNGSTGWPTAQARDSKGPQGRSYKGEGHDLPGAAKLAGWPTPLVFDAANNGEPRNLRYKGNAPSEQGNTRNPEATGSYRGELKDWVSHLVQPGQTPDSSNAETGKPAAFRLNPLFSLWLMGFPPHEWASCAELAMPSSRKSRRSLSGHI